MYYITDFTQNGAIKNCIKLRFNEQYTYGTWSKGKCALEDWITIALNRNTVFDWLPELECIHIIIDSIINYNKNFQNINIALQIKRELNILEEIPHNRPRWIKTAMNGPTGKTRLHLELEVDTRGYILPIAKPDNNNNNHTQNNNSTYYKRSNNFATNHNTSYTTTQQAKPNVIEAQTVQVSTKKNPKIRKLKTNVINPTDSNENDREPIISELTTIQVSISNEKDSKQKNVTSY